MNAKKSLVVASVYVIVSILIFVSDVISLGQVQDISVSPAVTSLVLLIPLFLWYRQYKQLGQLSSKQKTDKYLVWMKVFTLFLLAMAVRIPFVLRLGMAFEKTAVVYLVVLTVAFVEKNSLSVYGFKTEHFTRSLLIGLAYYLIFGLVLFTTFFGLTYAFTGQMVIVAYDLFPSLFVFPFMTFCVGVSEEGLFRGYMQTHLERVFTKRKALLIQALLFGVWHFVWHISPFDIVGTTVHVSSTFIFGLIFGEFYKESGNLIPLMLAHGLVDTIGYGAVFNPELENMQTFLQGSQALSFIVSMSILALCTRFLARKAQVATNIHIEHS
jgi:hypothetical protein